MSQLPAQLPANLQSSPFYPHFQTAYQVCLSLEDKIQFNIPESSGEERDILDRHLICSRILGYLLHHAPNEHARFQVYKEIVSCHDELQLLTLGQMYLDHYIRRFRSYTESISSYSTPSSSASTPTSYPSFDKLADRTAWVLENVPQSHSKAKLLALGRDGYCCAVTGIYGWKSVINNKELRERVPLDKRLVRVHCTHIIPESTNRDLEALDKVGYASMFWTIISNFGYPRIVKELNGSNIHRLENVLSLDASIHSAFASLYLWLVSTGNPNQYKVESYYPILQAQYQNYITLTTDDPKGLPLPSPEYLAIHASCGRIAHLSGAREYIEKLLRDIEDAEILVEDRGSATLLENALLHAKALGVTFDLTGP